MLIWENSKRAIKPLFNNKMRLILKSDNDLK